MSKQDGGPAFPTPSGIAEVGMTLRDYFAAHANEDDLACAWATQIETQHGGKKIPWDQTKARYLHADAMLAAREETR